MSPKTDEQNTLLKDERKEHILNAALHVFARRGFAATKIQDIAKQGGISHGLVYHYFKSKEDVFYELVSRAIYHAGQALLMVDALPLGPLEKVRQTARLILGSIASGQESSLYFMIVVHASVMESTPEERGRYLAGWEVPVNVFKKILEEGQNRGEIRPGDVGDMSNAFFSAIMGIAINRLAFEAYKIPEPEILVFMVGK